MTRSLRPLAVPGVFGLAVAVLLAAGDGELATPPLRGFGDWLEHRGAVVAAMALVRVAALTAAGGMLLLTLVSAVARWAGAEGLARAADHALPPAVRRALTGLAGAGAIGAALLGSAGGSGVGSAATGLSGEVLVRLGDEPPAPPEVPTATMSVLPEPAAPEWVVEPGDSFWSIAAELVTEGLGRQPSEAEVAAYWRPLVDANRDRLVSANPDLILPGQVFTLPPR